MNVLEENTIITINMKTCNLIDNSTGSVEKNDKQYLYLRSVVKVECGQNEGTAVCVHTSDANDRHLFLTCAHVVDHTVQSIILRYDGRAIKDILPCQISDKTPTIGQKMFSVGFPCREYVPSTSFGHMHRMIHSMLTTTCNVREGFSGGPVFSMDRKLLGLTVGRLNVGTIHFVLPSTEFVETINKYILTNNIEILNDLESKCLLKTVL
ncbi:uncharacterized protein LOC112597064 isoform X2 [Melanaphis sacchari]|uniref:uncharacterized protein LOC112597064 isoform X2 n=1 Tax=Melanaphis sacchari TaxID=742174 RepID=UPI000DC146CF|nr:uncharacterized protein LOC112597064 isoform X2 [Melanaphis sacchari]